MDNLIKELRKKPFSGEDILTVTDKKTKIITYPQLYEYEDIDQLLSPYDSVVILYETRPNYGHWVCVIKHPDEDKIEFFDPYGLPCDEQLNFIPLQFREQSNQLYPKLCEMLNNSPYDIVYNKKQLQKYSSDVSSCGRHVAFRIVMKNISLNEYGKMLSHNKYDPDITVTYLTAFL